MNGAPHLPVVSAVIPTRNRPDLVVRAVRSALAQTLRQIEVIVVIDGPDEATEIALQATVDERLRVVPLPAMVGGAEARNQGVRNARAEWIAFLDDDDEWLPTKLERQMQCSAETKVDFPIVVCQVIARSPKAEFLWPRRVPAENEPVSEYLFSRRSLYQGEGLVQTSMILAKSELLRAVPFSKGLTRHQEWDWLLRAMEVPGTCLRVVFEPLAIWYIEEERKSVSTLSAWEVSRDWIRSQKSRVTRRAYAGFLLTVTSSIAARSRAGWRAASALLQEATFDGKPSGYDYLLFSLIWIVPQNMRRGVRDLFSS
jgi:glycosyltransferase involved in cell wall biosynthesis